jgi:hypothetical protein
MLDAHLGRTGLAAERIGLGVRSAGALPAARAVRIDPLIAMQS